MAIKIKHDNTFSTYFVTFTCIAWIPLFKIANGYDMVYQWFDILKKSHAADIVAYVIMPNHLHVIIHFNNKGFNLNSIISNGKRFMAYKLLNRLDSMDEEALLRRLENMVTARERKKGQLHKVFKDSFDAKAIFTHRFMMQKIDYIHNNPVAGKWMLAKNYLEYEHSSASFYNIQVVQHFTPRHYLDV